MSTLNLKPAHKAVKAYFDELQAVAHLDFYDEGAVSPAFAELLRHCGRQSRLTLVEQYPLARRGRNLRVDGALVDEFKIPHGYWEAKDTKDDLDQEIQKKFDAGYPKDNILFQAPHRAIIYQDGRVNGGGKRKNINSWSRPIPSPESPGRISPLTVNILGSPRVYRKNLMA
jgi:hypothetical protein